MTVSRAIGWELDGMPRIVRGEGSYLFDAGGKRYLDGSGGPAAFSLGHANAEVNAAIAAQLAQVACGYRYLFTSDALEQLTAVILRHCGPLFGQIVFASSGSEAIEGAMKVALQYWTARGRPSKRRFIARERSYHGSTLGALSLSGFAERRKPFVQSLLDVSFVSAANAYRPPEGVAPADLTATLARELDECIRSLGPENVAAFVFEPVVGAAGGVVPAPPGYAQAVREVCSRHEVLLIADEVMCGSGRCGTWCALEHDGVAADIIAVAKGLAGGYIPLAATIFRRDIAAAIVETHGSILTGHTFSGHTAACAAGLAVQRIIERDALLPRVRTRGESLRAALRDSLKRFAEVGDVRGRGFFLGIEFVRDAKTRQPFPEERGLGAEIARRAFEDGLIVFPCAGNAGGGLGDAIIIAPPYNASDSELSELTDKFVRAVAATLK
ncbi:MAG: aspartate aminotransferase family protein [Steroidobacteraceae bacterium]